RMSRTGSSTSPAPCPGAAAPSPNKGPYHIPLKIQESADQVSILVPLGHRVPAALVHTFGQPLRIIGNPVLFQYLIRDPVPHIGHIALVAQFLYSYLGSIESRHGQVSDR